MAAANGQTNPFAKLFKPFDIRGAAKDGTSGYEQVSPLADVSQGVNKVETAAQPIQMAQASDVAFRINQLEEQVRQLTGHIEDLNFQLLQMQEQIRKMQEDNEFRFQELEKKGGLTTPNQNVAKQESNSLGKSLPSDQPASTDGTDGTARPSITEMIQQNDITGGPKLGEPPAALGTLTFDENGNLIDSNVGKPIDLAKSLEAHPEGLPNDPEQLFNLGYQYVQGGEYERAVEVFERYSADYPNEPRLPEARFWLGESLFSEGNYEGAAKVFLENHKAHPQAPLAAQNLLKLGVSLAGLDQRELACATYAEVSKKYPNASNAVRRRIEVEQQAAKCKNS
jgi:tol-pal system protein YbgF